MEAIAVIAGIVGLIWGAVVFLRGGLLGGCLAVLLAGTVLQRALLQDRTGFAAADGRPSAAGAAGRAIRRLAPLGLGRPKPLGKPEIILLVFVGDAGAEHLHLRLEGVELSAGVVADRLLSHARHGLLDRAAGEAVGARRAGGVRLPGRLRRLSGLTSLAEYFQAWWLVFPRYIATTGMDSTAEFVGRARGPLLHPIGNGILLAICLGSTLLWWPRLNRAGQLRCCAVTILLLAAIYCTLTRSVWIGGMLTLALVVGLAIPWNWRLPLLGGGLLVVLVATVAEWDQLVAFKRDKALGADKTAESVELRPIMAGVAWQMFLDRPLFGCGYSQYKTEHLNYVSDRSTDLPLERARGYIPHNVVFSLLTETGLVGLGLFAAMLIYWARDAWRLWRDTSVPLWVRQQGLLLLVALGVYMVNGMFHDVSVVPMANMALFFLAGVTAGLRPQLQVLGWPAARVGYASA